jgi:hypothetical protein
MKAPIAGGPATTLATSPAVGLAVDATSVYWVVPGGGGNPNEGSVNRIPLDGGTPTVLAANQGTEGSIAVDATSVYWAIQTGIVKQPLAGGTPIAIVMVEAPTILGLDSTSVYFTKYGGGIMKAPIDGGAPVMLAAGVTPGGGMLGAVDSTSVYYVDGNDVMKVSIAGGTPTTLAAAQPQIEGLALDSTNVYWTDFLDVAADGGPLFDAGTVKSVPIGGGTPTMVASGVTAPTAIAVDATSVYVSMGTPDCAIVRLTPK